MKKFLGFTVSLIGVLLLLYFNQDRTALHILTNDTAYAFTQTNHLKRITMPAHTIEYLHDTQGLKLAKKVDGKLKERYLWAGEGQLLAVLDADRNVLRQYVYANARAPLPYKMKANGNTYRLVFNPMRSLRIVMDEKNRAVKIVEYNDDGIVTKDTLPALKVDFGYAGGTWDEAAGLLFFSQGVYDLFKGVWLSAIKDTDIIQNLKQLNTLNPHDVYLCNATLDVYYHAYLCTATQCGGLYATEYLNYFNAQGAMIDNSPHFSFARCKRVELANNEDAALFSQCVKRKLSRRDALLFDAFSHNCHHEATNIILTCKAQSNKGRA
jgi:sulfur relay (sulfurtransferase) DsrF/TusC family protein